MGVEEALSGGRSEFMLPRSTLCCVKAPAPSPWFAWPRWDTLSVLGIRPGGSLIEAEAGSPHCCEVPHEEVLTGETEVLTRVPPSAPEAALSSIEVAANAGWSLQIVVRPARARRESAEAARMMNDGTRRRCPVSCCFAVHAYVHSYIHTTCTCANARKVFHPPCVRFVAFQRFFNSH